MTTSRMNRVGPNIFGLSLLWIVVVGQTVSAQGFGPDPFRPYNNQYDAYTYPISPPGADAAQAAAAMRSGVRGANQFENYLAEIQGLGRSGTERYGQGLPYFRSSIDPNFAKSQKRDYRPNWSTERSFEETQQRLTAKYLAYFEERDPKKRARLLREYQQFRRQTTRSLNAGRVGPPRVSEPADRGDSIDQPLTRERDAESRSTTRSGTARSRSSDLTTPNDRLSPPPPPRRSNRPNPPAGTSRSPSDVLERAGRLDGTGGTGRGSATDRSRGSRLPSDGNSSND